MARKSRRGEGGVRTEAIVVPPSLARQRCWHYFEASHERGTPSNEKIGDRSSYRYLEIMAAQFAAKHEPVRCPQPRPCRRASFFAC